MVGLLQVPGHYYKPEQMSEPYMLSIRWQLAVSRLLQLSGLLFIYSITV